MVLRMRSAQLLCRTTYELFQGLRPETFPIPLKKTTTTTTNKQKHEHTHKKKHDTHRLHGQKGLYSFLDDIRTQFFGRVNWP